MKKYLIFAASALVLASCSSDNFLGENPGNVQNATTAINFGGDAGKITRATSNEGDDHVKLGKEFKVYGVKTTDGTMFHNVFVDYSVWYDETLTTSNTNKWEYVGKNNQTIKYWDYSAKEYRFVAGSPISAFTFNVPSDGTTKNIESATITGLGGHIVANTTETANTFNPVYVAEPKVVPKADYKNTVQFNFVRQQSMVRVGIYETIPGYEITEINFYKQGENELVKEENNHNIILTSATSEYFVGGNSVNGTINYNWAGTTPSYTFQYTGNYEKSKNWYAGALKNGVKATTSAPTTIQDLYGTDGDMDANNGYFIVMPTLASEASAILIKCDYTLKSTDGSNEEIHVKGATAAIPAAYSKWENNTRYTYLFKISENTNGTTGGSNDPAGLYPITFDAVVTDEKQGTITTVATPSITTYQEGSVVDNTIKYVANKNIDVTVTESTSGTKQNLSTTGSAVGHIAVYKFTAPITEAEVQVKGTTGGGVTEVTDGSVADNVYSFTPDGEGYYAIQYLTTAAAEGKPAAYTYKVVYVAAN